VLGDYRGRARRTGRELDAPFAHLWTSDGDRLCSLRQYTDTALWCAALQERPDTTDTTDMTDTVATGGTNGPTAADHAQRVSLEITDGLAQLRLARPEGRNGIDMAMVRALADRFEVVASAPGCARC